MEQSSDSIFDLNIITESSNIKHDWVQRGTVLVCRSCIFKHGVYLSPDQKLVNIDKNNRPVIKSSQKANESGPQGNRR